LTVFAAALEPIQVVSLTVGIIGGTIIGLGAMFVLFEKVTGSLGRWFERHFKESLEPTNDRITELGQQVEHADAYNRHHLGPNGDTMPVHMRLKVVEQQVALVSAQDERMRRLIQGMVDLGPDTEPDE
jgi:hypothetical protein